MKVLVVAGKRGKRNIFTPDRFEDGMFEAIEHWLDTYDEDLDINGFTLEDIENEFMNCCFYLNYQRDNCTFSIEDVDGGII